jgi:hypothetical protein
MNGIVIASYIKGIPQGERGIITEHYRYSRRYTVYFPNISTELNLYSDEFFKCKKVDCKECKIRFTCWTN